MTVVVPFYAPADKASQSAFVRGFIDDAGAMIASIAFVAVSIRVRARLHR